MVEKNLPKRKPNRLENYNYSENGAYFITICTQKRKPILCNIVGEGSPLPQLTNQGRIVKNYIEMLPIKHTEISVNKYVIMPDHIHLLIVVENDGGNGRGNPAPTVTAAMGWFKYQATKEINKMCHTVGTKIFQRSYYDHVIRNEKDYKECLEYIDNNPIKWTIKNKTQEG